MGTVHYLPYADRHDVNQRITTGSHRDGLARKNFAERVIEQVRQYQSLPAWVIADHDLNRGSHTLMQSGWRFEIAFEHVRQVYF